MSRWRWLSHRCDSRALEEYGAVFWGHSSRKKVTIYRDPERTELFLGGVGACLKTLSPKRRVKHQGTVAWGRGHPTTQPSLFSNILRAVRWTRTVSCPRGQNENWWAELSGKILAEHKGIPFKPGLSSRKKAPHEWRAPGHRGGSRRSYRDVLHPLELDALHL